MAIEEFYQKARRNVFLTSGLLLLGVFIGITQDKEASSGFFPFRLDNPELIPHALSVLVVFANYNLIVCWARLIGETNQTKVQVYDFYVVVCSSAISLFLFAGVSLGLFSLIRNELNELEIESRLVVSLVASLLGVAISLVTAGSARRWARKISSLIRKDKSDIETKLHLILYSMDWVLIYNPKLNNAHKKISFGKDGGIGEGRNENESSWLISEGHLEIYRVDGSLQNRFSIDPERWSWISTNDSESDAIRRGIKNQKIVPERDWSDKRNSA